MNITFKVFNKLPIEAKQIRETVFAIEQGFNEEFDTSDNNALHVVMYDNDNPIGTSRIIYSDKHRSYTIGRFAIIKNYRKLGLGRKLIEFTEKVIIEHYGHIEIGLGAQLRAEPFYRKMGYSLTDDRYLDENYPHVWMIKKI